jgi:hypothetical protein
MGTLRDILGSNMGSVPLIVVCCCHLHVILLRASSDLYYSVTHIHTVHHKPTLLYIQIYNHRDRQIERDREIDR